MSHGVLFFGKWKTKKVVISTLGGIVSYIYDITFDGIQWVMLQRVFDLFTSWQVKFSRHHNIALWRIVPYCIMWCLWWECNTRSFEGCKQSIFEIKCFFFHALLDWNLALQTCSCFSLPDLLDHCNMRS